MRYAYTINDSDIRQELSPERVARLTGEGVALAILRRRHYRRGTEQHVGEYTDAEHTALLADGWELVKVLADGEDVAPTAAPTITEAQRIAAIHTDLPAHVRAAFASLGKLAELGVALVLDPLPGWDGIGAAIADAKAARAAANDFQGYFAIDAEKDRAEGHWKKVTFHIGEEAAYRLAPELARIP